LAESTFAGAWNLSDDFSISEARDVWAASQIQRAAVSVPANIAEGFKRRGRADKARFMNIAQASLEECRYFLILAQDLGYASSRELLSSLDEASRFLDNYCRALHSSSP
jgi:four helix bundle protein